MYCVQIRAIKSYATMSWRLVKPDEFGLWYEHFGHLDATMMHRIIVNTKDTL